MFDWIKCWWHKKPKSDGGKIEVEAIKLPEKNPFGCKKHPDYIPIVPPKNNCNDCWEYYSKGHIGKW
jgi:hypothetical protein